MHLECMLVGEEKFFQNDDWIADDIPDRKFLYSFLLTRTITKILLFLSNTTQWRPLPDGVRQQRAPVGVTPQKLPISSLF